MAQSAEYVKRVANISLFIYIGSPGLHPNSRQAPVYCRQSPGSSHQMCTYIYIHIYWATRRPIYIGRRRVNRGDILEYRLYIYIYIYTRPSRWHRSVAGESWWWMSNILYCLKTCENSHSQFHYATQPTMLQAEARDQLTHGDDRLTVAKWQCKLPSWPLVIIRCQRYAPYFIHLNLFVNIF